MKTKRNRQDYEFWIGAFSPEDMPMQRLGEYMTELGQLLGEKDSVHFRELRKGSTALGFEVEWEAIPKINHLLQDVKTGEASNDATYAQDQINKMLREDNAVGELRRITDGQPELLIRFPGREIPKPERIGPFAEPTTIKGELVRIEGEDDTKHAGIKDAQGRVWSGIMSRELAIQMREFLFEWVVVEGTASWMRNEDSAWDMKRFKIQDCKLLSKDSLEDDIHNLRNIPGNEWKNMTDPLGFIRESRNDDDEIH
jgi:hypothetical protein